MKKEERKKEIMDTSLRLFLTKGFEETSIQNIIDEISISKGGFYHHYKSKNELLDAIALKKAEDYVHLWRNLKEYTSLSGKEKFIEIFRISNNIKIRHFDETIALWSILYEEKNLRFRIRLLEKQIEYSIPVIAPYVQQAIDEGDFDTPYPEESVALIIRYSDKMMETILPLLIQAKEDKGIIPQIYEKYHFMFFIMERVLGAEKGSIAIFPPNYLEDIYK